MAEYDEQVLVIQRAQQLRDINPSSFEKLRYLHSSLNGATLPAKMVGLKRISTVGYKLRKAGMRSGIADLYLPVLSGNFCGLYIEMKALKGTVDPKQRMWLHAMAREMRACAICYTADVVISPDLRTGLLVDYVLNPFILLPHVIYTLRPGKIATATETTSDISYSEWQKVMEGDWSMTNNISET